MKLKTTLAFLATLITVSSPASVPAASAAASIASNSSTMAVRGLELTKLETSRIQNHETVVITSQTGRYINLGKAYFSKAENQGVSVSSSFGSCVTDKIGCWSEDKEMYLPLLIKTTELASGSSLDSDVRRFIKANGWDIALGVAGSVAATSASVLLVAMLPVSVPVVVITTATVATRVATAGGGLIAACRSLWGGCR